MTAQPQQTEGQKNAAMLATKDRALDLHKLTLIAVMGRPDARRAILRHRNGHTETVQTGTSVAGGTVMRIDENSLVLALDGKPLKLAIPAS